MSSTRATPTRTGQGFLSITRKIWLSVSILLVGYAGSTVLGFSQGGLTCNELDQVSENLFPASVSSQVALNAFREQIAHFSDGVTLGEPEAVGLGTGLGLEVQGTLKVLHNQLPLEHAARGTTLALERRVQAFTQDAGPVYGDLSEGMESPELTEAAASLAHRFQEIEGELIGLKGALAMALRTSLSSIAMNTQQQQYFNLAVFVTVVVSALLLVAQIVNRSITRPLLETVAFARTMAAGDLSQKLKITQRDEIGELASAINVMAVEIEKSHNELEDKVRARTAELKQAHKELMVAARQAGMADVASAVLHNVGNILNSVTVTTGSLRSRNTESKTQNLAKAAAMLEEHADRLTSFLDEDPKGQKLAPYVIKISKHLEDERLKQGEMLESLQEHIQHIGEIISRQQTNSRAGSVHQEVDVPELIADCVEIVSAGSTTSLAFTKDYDQELAEVFLDRHKVMQILVNLLSNAKQATEEGPCKERRISIRAYSLESESIAIEIEDNGIGIEQKNLSNLFTHGFTTKVSGHGFGLHSACLAAKEMGGTLVGSSSGLGQGACFRLELPAPPVEVHRA